jgi:hypothetical protein
MHLATINKTSETRFQVIFLYENMVGPHWCDAFPTRYAATKYINEVTEKNRKIVNINTLFKEHDKRVKNAYYETKEPKR